MVSCRFSHLCSDAANSFLSQNNPPISPLKVREASAGDDSSSPVLEEKDVPEIAAAASNSVPLADAKVAFPDAAADKYRKPLYQSSPVTVLLFALIMVDWQVSDRCCTAALPNAIAGAFSRV